MEREITKTMEDNIDKLGENFDEIRWKQRLSNYEKAFLQLKEAVEVYQNDPLPIIKEGIIQRFEFTHELSWKLLKDYLKYQGIQNITGSRDSTKQAFNIGLITNGQIWMDMIESRNKTVHTYDEDILESEYFKITNKYYPLFAELLLKMKEISKK